jgi:hypothetical protein
VLFVLILILILILIPIYFPSLRLFLFVQDSSGADYERMGLTHVLEHGKRGWPFSVPPMATAHGNPSGVTSSRRVSTGRNSPSGRESRPTERGQGCGGLESDPNGKGASDP